jgi:hypothetical protein
MKLFLRHPSQAGQMRIQRVERRLATGWKFEANEKPFRPRHSKR